MSRNFSVRYLLRAAAFAFLGFTVECSQHDEAPSAPPADSGTRILRIRRTDGVVGGPQEDSLSFPAGQSVSYAFQPAPRYVSVSVRLDSAATSNSGTIRMTSDHLLAVGATPSITSAPRDSSLATLLANITVASDPRAAALSASHRIDSLVQVAGSAEAIKSAANAVALAATTPLLLTQRLRADSAMWNFAVPVSLQPQTGPTVARAGARTSGAKLQPAVDQLPVEVIYLNGIRLRYEKFLSEVPAFQAIVRGANIAGDLRGSAYYSKTSGGLAEAVNPGSDCGVLTWMDALESRSDYVDIARRFGRCIGADAGQPMANLAKALAPGISSDDAVGATEHVTKSLRGDRAVILIGYSQGALVSQEVIRAIKAANDPKLDAGNCVGFVSMASPFHVDDVVAPGLIAGTIAKGTGVQDLMLYMPGPKAAGLTNELATKYDADNNRLSDSPALRSAHAAWSAYHLHDFVENYQSSALGATFVQSKLRDIATALRERCGLGRELAVERSAVALSALTGTSPASTTIAVSNAGIGTIDELSASVAYSGQSSGWLTAGLSSTTTPATLTLSAASAVLPAGTYSATVTISARNAAVKNAPSAIPVTLTVASRPILTVEPTSLSFNAVSGSEAQTQVVRIENSGAGTLGDLSLGAVEYGGQPSDWLTATLDRSTAPASLRVTANFGNVVPGTYTATIPVQTAQGGVNGSPRLIAVTATVAASQPSLGISTNQFTFSTLEGGSATAGWPIQIFNGGGGTVAGLALSTITYGAGGTGWLSVSLSNTTAPAVITASAAPGALPPGFYTAAFTIASTTPGVSPRTINVYLTVNALTPNLSVSSSIVSFNAAQGGVNPAAQTIQIRMQDWVR